MPLGEDGNDTDSRKGASSGNISSTHHGPRHWWSLPTPVRRLFDNFPLQTYAANELPQRAPTDRTQHLLYVFTTPEAARRGEPSFNPSCLKWQVRQENTISPNRSIADRDAVLDISEGLRNRAQHRAVEQPCITHRGPAFRSPVCLFPNTPGRCFVAYRLE